ncbi:MAG: hypothetical protein DMD96_02550 [Candidatus Rokuibacteriota bacterium]|nr:MAG: hypothetical protein DMD96_02550 [Candidatus Rokubacteria bacterium]
MTANARSILSAVLLALTAVVTTACGTTSTYLTPSRSTTTLMEGWDHWFKLDWSVDSEPGGGKRIRGYITNEHGEAAEPLRLLAQALDASDAVVGQKIAWVPEGVGGFERAYFEISHLPAADHYRVSVWDYSFLQAESERP